MKNYIAERILEEIPTELPGRGANSVCWRDDGSEM